MGTWCKGFHGPRMGDSREMGIPLPVKHRTPVPENVVCAMCVLAWHMQWWSWVGATILSFYGAGRLGEVLRCPREDLVLPRDVFETTVQETNWDAQREKACVNTYAHASAS